jgi:hypothetical protein
MKKEMFLPVTVHGEDVIIDYFKKDIIFPNRNDDSDFDMQKASSIAVWLKEEGFLDGMEIESVDSKSS